MKEISSIIRPSRRGSKFSRIASWRDLTELNRPSRSVNASIDLTVGRLLLTPPRFLFTWQTHSQKTHRPCLCVHGGYRSILPSTHIVIHPNWLSIRIRMLFIYYNASLSCMYFYSWYWNQKLPVPSRYTFSCFVDPLGKWVFSPRSTILNSLNRLVKVYWFRFHSPIPLNVIRCSQERRSTVGKFVFKMLAERGVAGQNRQRPTRTHS